MLASEKPIIEGILKYSDIHAIADEDIGSLVHVAAESNNIALAEVLVKKNMQLNIVNKIGISPLKYAAKRGSERVLRFLLDSKADPNYVGEKLPGFSPLNIAVQFGQFSCAKVLLDYGADVASRDMVNSALHSAAMGGHAKIAKHLIKVAGLDVNQRGNGNKTPLYFSITYGHSSMAKLLILHGADPNAIGYDRETLMHVAVREGRKEIMVMLLEAGAKSDEPLKNGLTPLMLAVKANYADYIPHIIAHGYTLSKKDEDGNGILHHIARNNSCASAKRFLPKIQGLRGVDIFYELFERKNDANMTPYEVALKCRHQPILKIFIGYAPKDFYKNDPKQVHAYYDAKLFDTLKVVINRSVEVDEHRGELS